MVSHCNLHLVWPKGSQVTILFFPMGSPNGDDQGAKTRPHYVANLLFGWSRQGFMAETSDLQQVQRDDDNASKKQHGPQSPAVRVKMQEGFPSVPWIQGLKYPPHQWFDIQKSSLAKESQAGFPGSTEHQHPFLFATKRR